MDSRVKEVIKMFERMNAMKQRIIISLLAKTPAPPRLWRS